MTKLKAVPKSLDEVMSHAIHKANEPCVNRLIEVDKMIHNLVDEQAELVTQIKTEEALLVVGDASLLGEGGDLARCHILDERLRLAKVDYNRLLEVKRELNRLISCRKGLARCITPIEKGRGSLEKFCDRIRKSFNGDRAGMRASIQRDLQQLRDEADKTMTAVVQYDLEPKAIQSALDDYIHVAEDSCSDLLSEVAA